MLQEKLKLNGKLIIEKVKILVNIRNIKISSPVLLKKEYY